MRPKITITNVDKTGKVSNKWYVRVGRNWKLFNKTEWDTEGVSWIREQLAGKVG